MRRFRPVSTLPGPHSTIWVAPAGNHGAHRRRPIHRRVQLLDQTGANPVRRAVGLDIDAIHRDPARLGAIGVFSRRTRSCSAAGCMSELCAGTLIGSAIARRAPLAVAISIARATAAAWPAITTWPGALKLTASTTSPCDGLAARRLDVDVLETEDGRHGALTRRHRRLHQFAAILAPDRPHS